MHLLATDLEIPHQSDELIGDGGGIVRYLKAFLQVAHPFDYHLRC